VVRPDVHRGGRTSTSGPSRHPAVLSAGCSGRRATPSSWRAGECDRCLPFFGYGAGVLGLLTSLGLLLRVLASPTGGWGSRGATPSGSPIPRLVASAAPVSLNGSTQRRP
jgi:hypothetical protein